jgi:hypothetical protein
VKERAQALFKDTGLFDDADWRAFQAIVDGNNKEFIWDVVDAKYYTTPERAMALTDHWLRRDGRDSVPISNKKMLDEARKGIVSVGRLTMIADDSDTNMNWEAHLDLHDEDSVARLEGYIGVWREGRQGFRAQPATPPGTVAPRPARAPVTGPGKPAPAISTFNNQYNALAKRVPGVTLPSRAEIFSRMRNMGMTFENAVRSAALTAKGSVSTRLSKALGPLNLAPAPRASAANREHVDLAVAFDSGSTRAERFVEKMEMWNAAQPKMRRMGATAMNRVWQRTTIVGEPFDTAVATIQKRIKQDNARVTAKNTASNKITAKQLQQFDANVRRWNKTHPPGQGIGMQTENRIWRMVNDAHLPFDVAAHKKMKKQRRGIA